MRRTQADETTSQGEDSFLDIVANMVGILILLVMVVGLRASKLPSDTWLPGTERESARGQVPPSEADEQTAELPRQVADLQSELNALARQVAANEQEEKLREMERVHLAAHSLEVQQELERRKTELSDVQRGEHEIVQSLTMARNRLNELTEAQMAVFAQPTRIETIENLPTPLAQTVLGDELHLRLKGGMVSVIPLDELVKGLEQHAKDNAWKLSGQSVLDETLGPVNGYRLRYRLVQRRVVVQSAAGPINQGSVVQLEGWELLPLAEDLGQPVEQALLPRSDLRRALAGKRPEKTTITVWTYPESFGEFRRLKKSLYEMGYATAARPLPDGLRIGGSPRGSKSAAQ